MSELTDIIKNMIRHDGPMDLARYMEFCLTHPQYGYYVTRDPFGGAGDFVTAPEVSQMFGEMIGLWLALYWQNSGSPKRLNLIELGPGRGTLMADLLRGTRNVAGLHQALTITFVEKSPTLMEKQREAINASGFSGEVSWAEHLNDVAVDSAMSVVIGNEFLDALPIHQCTFTEKGWMERAVGLSDDGQLQYGLIPVSPLLKVLIEERTDTPAFNDLVEISPERDAYIRDVCAVIKKNNGAALFIDYGHDVPNAKGDTFQAMRDHGFVEALKKSGHADLTSHVDFFRTKQVAEAAGAACFGTMTQGDFLHHIGIGHRAQNLVQNAGDKAEDIYNAYKRLTDADQMGDLFKVVAFTYNDKGVPIL